MVANGTHHLTKDGHKLRGGFKYVTTPRRSNLCSAKEFCIAIYALSRWKVPYVYVEEEED